MKIRMTSYFPDINARIALSVACHTHNGAAIHWLNLVRRQDRLVFARYTQMGFLRLLTDTTVMGDPAPVRTQPGVPLTL
jgi:hypothetical protein